MQGKVALISGGGSGHEPLHGGFVGLGMLDAACPGEVFTSPVPDQMLAATKAVDGGAGVVHIVKNYTGDVMNFKLAAEDAADEGIGVESVLIDDDVAVQDSLYTAGRRGVGATVLLEKIAGAAAERGDDLAAVAGDRAPGQRALALVRRRAVVVHAAGGGQADLRPARRARSSSASASTASRAGAARRSAPRARSPTVMVEAVLSDLGAGERRAACCRSSTAWAARRSSSSTCSTARSRRSCATPGSSPSRNAGRQLHHVAGDGGRVADAARARRRAGAAVGCSRPHRRAPLGSVSASGRADPPCATVPSSTLDDREPPPPSRRAADYLTQLDAAIGDGDHGINMTRGFAAVGKALAGQDETCRPAAC